MIFIRDLIAFVHNVFMTSGRAKKFDLSYWIYHVTAVDFDNKYAYCNSFKIQFDLDDACKKSNHWNLSWAMSAKCLLILIRINENWYLLIFKNVIITLASKNMSFSIKGSSLYGVRISKIEWNLIFTTVNKINNHS